MPVVFTSAFSQGYESAPQGYFFDAADYTISQTPQVWLDHQIYEEGGELVVSWDAVDEIFPSGLLDQMFDAYVRFLERLAADDAVWKEKLGTYMLPNMLEQIARYNDTDAPLQPELLHQAFLRRAAERPNAPAVLTSDREISYGALFRASLKLGHFLKEQQVRPNELIALMMPKGWEQIVAVLGILQAGGAYLNIDPELPLERRNYLMENGRVRVVITREDMPELEIPADRAVFRMGPSILETKALSPLDPVQAPDDLAYVIYTSGSTGLPKGVMISHRAAHNTIVDIIAKFGLTGEDRIFGISSLSFDLSVFDLFGALSVGAAIVLPPPNSERDADQTARILEQHRVTVWNSVPALLELLVESLEARGKKLDLRLALLSGDWIPVTLPDRIRRLSAGTQVVSLGGATEASIWSIYYPIGEVDPAWASIPYGMPLANQKIHVLNKRFEPCPEWVVGDIYIGGIGLAEGYWEDRAKTDAAFVTHPATGERLYRTFDLGRYLPQGYVEFLGREDFQIKIGGFRVELGEIESTLNQNEWIRRAAVKKVVGKDRNELLAAYFALNAKGRLELETASKSGDYGMEIKGEGNLLLDPVERLRFKLSQPGLRAQEGAMVQLPGAQCDIETFYVKRGTSRRFTDENVSLESIGKLLGCLRQTECDGLTKYRYGSAGGLYPVQVYIYIQPGRVEGIDGGGYYYDPRAHALLELGAGVTIDPAVHVAANRSIHDGSAFSIFLVARMDAITPMYGDRAMDFCLIEAGLITQLLESAGVENGLGFCQIGGFQDNSFVTGTFQLEERQPLLHALIGGCVDYADPARTTPVAEQKKGSPQGLIAEIRSYCAERLPKYMVPSQWVILEEMPLSGVGKINYKALPDPFENVAQVVHEYVKPRNELEKIIAEILSEKLGTSAIDINTNFFDMGADSMMITRVYRVLVEKCGIDFPVIRMFEYASVASLARYLSEMRDETSSYDALEEKAARQRQALEKRKKAQNR
jgi:amino acid adenylation domain-containing protein